MKLSRTEAHILSTLEQANGEVVSRQSFGIESESNLNSNVIEVMVCRLRKKLKEASAYDDHGTREIQTVRGIGYRLVTP